MKNSKGVNDFAERNIRLIQDFIHSYKAEDMKQSVLHVATDSRGKNYFPFFKRRADTSLNFM